MALADIYLIEPLPMLAEGFSHVIERSTSYTLGGSALTVAEALEPVGSLAPAVLISGAVSFSAISQTLRQLHAASPKSKIVIWADMSSQDQMRTLQMGAKGVMRKAIPVQGLLECVRTVLDGGMWLENSTLPMRIAAAQANRPARLTAREREVIEHVSRGMKNREIAEALQIKPGTVKVHLLHIFEKAGVRDRFQLALQAEAILDREQRA